MEQQEKQKYINDNIIEKGYNPEDLSNFITRLKGVSIEALSLKELQICIEQFKTEQLTLSLQLVNKKRDKKATPFEVLYSDCEYDVITGIQPETKLMELEKEKKKINVKIAEPKIEKGSFFSKDQITFSVITDELNSNVKRNYSDFEWYKYQLNSRYPFILVPPILKEAFYSNINLNIFGKKKNEELPQEKESLHLKLRYLTKFMNGVIRKKILRTAPITFEFLTLEKGDFEKYKKHLEQNPFSLNITLNNFNTIKGKMKVSLNKDKAVYVNNLSRLLIPTTDLHNKLRNSFNLLIQDLNTISIHMKEIGQIYEKLASQAKDIKQSNIIKNLYSNLKEIFTSYSNNYLNQSKFFKEDFWEFFDYMNMEFNEIDTIIKQFQSQRSEYETFANNLNIKKEQLFITKDISKWEVKAGTENQIPLYQNDKKKAFAEMCYKETKVIDAEKKIVVIAIDTIIDQFRKLKKYQGERGKDLCNRMNEEKEKIFGDLFNLMNLITMKCE